MFEQRGQRSRALALARRARDEYQLAAKSPLVVRDLAELELWLAKNDRPAPRAKPKRSKSKPAKPKAAKRKRGR